MEKNKEKIKFEELVDDFLSYKQVSIKSSTLSNYTFCIKHRLNPYFKNKALEDLKMYNFNKFTNKLSETLSSKTIRDTIVLLKEILRFAERKYDIDFKLDLISVTKEKKKDVVIFKEDERRKIEEYIFKDDDIRNLGIIISLYSGLRIGEVCALKWKNIDLVNDYIEVDSTTQRVYIEEKKTGVIIGNPKTDNSKRKIPLAKKLKEKLEKYSGKYSEYSFVLTGKEDKHYEPISYRLYYKKILEDLGVNYKNYHTLRHTFSTRCIQAGMDVKSLSEILGHSNVNITLNIYVHSNFETKKKFINKL